MHWWKRASGYGALKADISIYLQATVDKDVGLAILDRLANVKVPIAQYTHDKGIMATS
jgi:hypothetical protein